MATTISYKSLRTARSNKYPPSLDLSIARSSRTAYLRPSRQRFELCSESDMLVKAIAKGEHEAIRKIKNEFMTHWNGLLSKPGEGILVLAARNRPFDLDEAIIRHFERR